MKYAWLPMLVAFVPGAAMAGNLLPAGGVACLSLKDAKAYAEQQADAPDFADDLLARAACFEVKEPVEAVKAGRAEQGFQPYRLLSGHKVWLPVSK